MTTGIQLPLVLQLGLNVVSANRFSELLDDHPEKQINVLRKSDLEEPNPVAGRQKAITVH